MLIDMRTLIVEKGKTPPLRCRRLGPAALPTELFPLVQVAANLVGDVFRAHRPAERVDEFAVRVHEVEEDGMVDEVVVARFGVGWRREVDSAAVRGCGGKRRDGFMSGEHTTLVALQARTRLCRSS